MTASVEWPRRKENRVAERSRPRGSGPVWVSYPLHSISLVSVTETRVSSPPLVDEFIHAATTTTRDGLEREDEEKKRVFRGKACTLTSPCCSAAPPLLDCSPWTDSCCCIHSSVSLQRRRNGAMKIVCYIASDRSARFLVGNETVPLPLFPFPSHSPLLLPSRPPSSFFADRPSRCKCNSTRCGLRLHVMHTKIALPRRHNVKYGNG